MAISGLIGAGAQDALADLLQRQMVEQQLAERTRQFDAEQQRRQAEDAQQASQFDANLKQRQAEVAGEAERDERSRRDRNNASGVQEMLIQRRIMDEEEARNAPKPIKLREVRTRGEGGRPINRMVPEDEAVEEYVAPQSSGGGGQRPITGTAEANLVSRLAGQWTQASKNVREMDEALATMGAGMNAAARGDNGPASEAIMVTFQKVLDPGSVVREAEFWRSASGQSLRSRVEGAMERLRVGGQGIPIGELQKYAQLAKEARDARARNTSGVRTRIGKVADRYGIPQELVFDSDAGMAEPTPAQPPPGGMAPVSSHGGSAPSGGAAPAAPKRMRFDAQGNPIP